MEFGLRSHYVDHSLIGSFAPRGRSTAPARTDNENVQDRGQELVGMFRRNEKLLKQPILEELRRTREGSSENSKTER